MAYTVNACFEQFIKDEVNLNPARTKTARDSRDWLISQIENLADCGKIPPLHTYKNHLFFGSFARNTKIRPLDDIDLMMVFDAQGSTTDDITKMEGKSYPIYVWNPITIGLSDYCDGNVLNSRKMIEGLKRELSEIPNYSKAELHRNQEAVTLKLSSYEWNFDIVPAFVTNSDFYVIPDGNGSWKGTDPRIDQERTTTANQNFDDKLLTVIRLMKYWKKKYWGNEVSSYLFENFMVDWANSLYIQPSSYKGAVKMALDVLASKILMDYTDPKGFQGNINTLSTIDRLTLSWKASSGASLANDAMAEENYGNTVSAINKWIELFGDKFPSYGE